VYVYITIEIKQPLQNVA